MDSKTYVFGENGNQNFDPNLLFGMMMGGGGFGGFGGGNWLWPLLLFALWGNNGFGFGGFGGGGNRGGCCGNAAGFGFLSDQINNDAGRELIMQAIQGNNNAISQLATTLNCNIGELRTALNAISGKICDVANSVGMSSLQVINAITSGNATLASQLASCCCDLKGAIQESNYLTERGFCNTNQILSQGFSSVAYETQRQTCDIEKAIADSTSKVLEGQRAAEMRDLQDKIDMLREKNAQQAVILNNAQQTSQFAAMLAPIQADLAELKCNQIPVKKIACPDTYVPLNRSINENYGLVPNCGFNAFGGWNGWGGNCNTFNWG